MRAAAAEQVSNLLPSPTGTYTYLAGVTASSQAITTTYWSPTTAAPPRPDPNPSLPDTRTAVSMATQAAHTRTCHGRGALEVLPHAVVLEITQHVRLLRIQAPPIDQAQHRG